MDDTRTVQEVGVLMITLRTGNMVAFPFMFGEHGGVEYQKNVEAINDLICLAVSIAKGEYRYHDNIGSSLWGLLGQKPNSIHTGLYKTLIREDVEAQVKGISVIEKDIKIEYDSDMRNTLRIHIPWVASGTGTAGVAVYPYTYYAEGGRQI